MIQYRQMLPGEEKKIYEFVAKVFNEFVAPQFSLEGCQTFLSSSIPENIRDRVSQGGFVLIAVENGEIAGVIEVVKNNSHIARFFVRGCSQQKGIGRELMNQAIRRCRENRPNLSEITVNSSPNALNAYEALGFRTLDTEQTSNGIRYTPMKLCL